MLIFGILGCTGPKSLTVVEYRPTVGEAMETTAYSTEQYRLLQWVPRDPPVGEPPPAVTPQFPSEVWRVVVTEGSPIGFRRVDGHLIAVAGDRIRPLPEAHYSWDVPNTPAEADETDENPWADILGALFEVGVDGFVDGLSNPDQYSDHDHQDHESHHHAESAHHEQHHQDPHKEEHDKPTSRP